jgi:methionyl-tRNA synthetase
VWFEAVIGYLSAAIEAAKLSGRPEAWKDWWVSPEAKSFYFIGKDNMFFHTAFWPAQLMGAGEKFLEIFAEEADQPLNLPYDVPANQFMNLEGEKISGSRNWAVWGLDFLTRYDPDSLRFYLTVNMPENRDTDWDWKEFVERNNNSLVATWGNLANRVLSFAYKHWEGQVPTPGEMGLADKAIIAAVEEGFQSVGTLLQEVRLRAALVEALRLAGEVNKYIDSAAPWFTIKNDKAATATTIYTALRAIDSLKVLFAPFLPFTCERLHTYLGYTQPLFGSQYIEEESDSLGVHAVLRYQPAQASGKWEPSQLAAGQRLLQPAPLFKKLDESIADEERARLGK